MSRACIDVVLVFETTADRALAGQPAGTSDAQSASRQAAELGMPHGRPIYFAVDFDATPQQQPVIDAYFRGVVSTLGPGSTGPTADTGFSSDS
jgi:hypothetical protein